MKKRDKGMNVTLTLDEPMVQWLDHKVVTNDSNRSREARVIFREAMGKEKTKARKVQA